jgi:hypothetical protein
MDGASLLAVVLSIQITGFGSVSSMCDEGLTGI